jgi:hypothetical protein
MPPEPGSDPNRSRASLRDTDLADPSMVVISSVIVRWCWRRSGPKSAKSRRLEIFGERQQRAHNGRSHTAVERITLSETPSLSHIVLVAPHTPYNGNFAFVFYCIAP